MKIYILIIACVLILVACGKTSTDLPHNYYSQIEGKVTLAQIPGDSTSYTALISAYRSGQSELEAQATTDSTGFFRLVDLPTDTYRLHIAVPDTDYKEYNLENVVGRGREVVVLEDVLLNFIRKIPRHEIVIDGVIDAGWDSLYANEHLSSWSDTNNFENFYLARNDSMLFVAITGGFDNNSNTINLYIDRDYEAGTGISEFNELEGGNFGAHVRKEVSAPENFGADAVFSIFATQYDGGVALIGDGSGLDQNLLPSTGGVYTDTTLEFSIKISELFEGGMPSSGDKIAIIGIIGNGGVMSNDTLPQQVDEAFNMDGASANRINFSTVLSRSY